MIRQRLSFDDAWHFHLGDLPQPEAFEGDAAGWQTVQLPHDWSVSLPFTRDAASATGFLPGGIGWYRKRFATPEPLPPAGRVAVEFDGVYMNSEVWLNGTSLGRRPYGYSSFRYDLTELLCPAGEENVIAVRVDRSVVADSRWYPGSGIYRHVWLTLTGPVRVAHWGTFVTTPDISPGRAAVRVTTRVENSLSVAARIGIQTVICGADGDPVAEDRQTVHIDPDAGAVISQDLEVAEPDLWSCESPVLYCALSRIRIDDECVDEYRTPFGIRDIRFDADHGFFLNGVPTKMRGVCVHHDAGALGAAVPEAVWERRLRRLRRLGCNAVRTSHNPMAPEFYDLCDRLGLLVMDEAFDEWTGGKNKWEAGRNVGQVERWGYHVFFEEWGLRDARDMVLRDRNHPCIVLWSIGNEVDFAGDPFTHECDEHHDPARPHARELVPVARQLTAAVKALDETRPVTVALANTRASNATGLADVVDVAGYNYHERYYAEDHLAYPRRAILGSENGHSLEAWQAVADNGFIGSQFLWTGIDYLGEAGPFPNRGFRSGLLDTCGFIKPRGRFREALWADRPVLHLLALSRELQPGAPGHAVDRPVPHWNWDDDPRPVISILAYTNCDEVELELNGESIGCRALAEAPDRILRWDVAFHPGTLVARGQRQGENVECRLQTVGPPVAVSVSPDRERLSPSRRDVTHLEIGLADADGRSVVHEDRLIEVKIRGAGRLLGLDNGNQFDIDDLSSPVRRTCLGRALAVVEAQSSGDWLEVTISGDGLRAAVWRCAVRDDSLTEGDVTCD